MPCCDPSKVLQVADDNLDPVAALVMASGPVAKFRAGDAASYPVVFQPIWAPACIMSEVGDQPLGGRKAARHCLRDAVVAHLAHCREELQQTASGIRDRM